jgi:Deoxyribodipyrimidine photolyase
MKTVNIFWFRRDLRLHDNVGFYNALNAEHEVLPIFIFDDAILSKLPKQDARLDFIHHTLQTINTKLKDTYKSGIHLFLVNQKLFLVNF